MFESKSRKPVSAKNEFSSSGFHSEVSAQLKQSLSSNNVQSVLTSGLGMGSDRSLAPYLTSLWGKSAAELNRRRLPTVASSHPSSKEQSWHHVSHKPILAPNAPAPVPEFDILRELVFVLNGVGGELIHYDQATDSFRLTSKLYLHPGDRDCVHRIAECGWLHNRIRQFVTAVQQDQLAGQIIQSLASGLHENLAEYYRLIATLESQLGRESRGVLGPLSNLPSADDTSTEGPRIKSNVFGDDAPGVVPSIPQNLTLTRLALWTQEPRFRLRLLASLCDVCRGKRGGALASEVFAYTQIGDPTSSFMFRMLLKNVCSTLLHQIGLWIYDGQLDDPYQEFFVASNPTVKTERLWHEKYSIRRSMIPTFITSMQASKILLAGKSINFLQHACGEKRNIKDRESIRNTRLKRAESLFEQDLDSSFDRMVSTVYKQTSGYLLETLIGRYHFMEHLRATRQFLLLGQGDFITHLMDLLDADLSKPATQLLHHQLSSTLETAIRATNAQYEQPEILQRLDVRLLEMSTGDTGWDVFSLDYHVDGPLATVFTDDCRLMYLRAFNFLWRAKRMEFSLSALWKDQFLMSRMDHSLHSDLEPVLHLSELFGAELRHCVQQLQYYVNFEVLECAWDVLVKRIHAATDLDEIISAHQTFLSGVITQCLLDTSSRQLIGQLRTIFDLILGFTEVHHELCSTARTELAARERYANEVCNLTNRGNWGTNDAKETRERSRRQQFVQRYVGPFQARIRILASSYREMVINFIRMLCTHPDHNLRFLAEHLNFNGHYHHHGRLSFTGTSASTMDELAGSLASSFPRSGAHSSGSGVPDSHHRQHSAVASADGDPRAI